MNNEILPQEDLRRLSIIEHASAQIVDLNDKAAMLRARDSSFLRVD